ncbi:hypothetical protein BDR22DRAFT_829103 [Usnea florida]
MNAIDLDEFDRLARQQGHPPMDNREDLMLPPLDQVVQQPIPGGVAVAGPLPYQHFLSNVYTPPPLDRQRYQRSPDWPTVLNTPTPSPAPSGLFARGSTAFLFELVETTQVPLIDTSQGGGDNNTAERGGLETPLRGALETPDVVGNPTPPRGRKGAKKEAKGRNKGMKVHQKITLARICVDQAAQYGVMKMQDFWDTVKTLLLEQADYSLKTPRQTVMKWVTERIEEMVEEEMGSGTEVERDEFKAAVEKFAERVEAYKEEVEAKKKTAEEIVQEAHETARVQMSMLSGLYDEDILGRDTPLGSDTPAPRSRTSTPSIALNKGSSRQHRSTSAALLVDGMERSIGRLADALIQTSQAPGTKRKREDEDVAQRFDVMEQRMDRVEGGIAKILDKLTEI